MRMPKAALGRTIAVVREARPRKTRVVPAFATLPSASSSCTTSPSSRVPSRARSSDDAMNGRSWCDSRRHSIPDHTDTTGPAEQRREP
jgi:hypothetical protein